MQFFITTYKKILNRPYIKFVNNLYILTQMTSINFVHTLYPHFFLSQQLLKIKFIKTYNFLAISKYVYIYLFSIIIFSILFFIV